MKTQRPSQHGGKSPTSVAKPAISQNADENEFSVPISSSTAFSQSRLRSLVLQPTPTSEPDSSPCSGTFTQSNDLTLEEELNHDPGFGFGGITEWKPENLEVGTEVICDADVGVWKARVDSFSVKIVTVIGVAENILTDDAIIDADCELLAQMEADITDIISSPGRPDPERSDYWIPDGFVEKHEQVHIKHIRKAFEDNYAQLVTDIEGLTLPCGDYTQTEADSELQDGIEEAIK